MTRTRLAGGAPLQVLRAYARFLDDVALDAREARRVRSAADRLEADAEADAEAQAQAQAEEQAEAAAEAEQEREWEKRGDGERGWGGKGGERGMARPGGLPGPQPGGSEERDAVVVINSSGIIQARLPRTPLSCLLLTRLRAARSGVRSALYSYGTDLRLWR